MQKEISLMQIQSSIESELPEYLIQIIRPIDIHKTLPPPFINIIKSTTIFNWICRLDRSGVCVDAILKSDYLSHKLIINDDKNPFWKEISVSAAMHEITKAHTTILKYVVWRNTEYEYILNVGHPSLPLHFLRILLMKMDADEATIKHTGGNFAIILLIDFDLIDGNHDHSKCADDANETEYSKYVHKYMKQRKVTINELMSRLLPHIILAFTGGNDAKC